MTPIRDGLTRRDIVEIVREECEETIDAAGILDDAGQRTLVRTAVAVLWGSIRRRVEA